MRIGVLGGTFDPVHIGHLLIAEEARVSLRLEEVVFVPAGQPYFKADQHVTEGRHRLAMVELAVDSNPCFTVSDVELRRSGPSYTADTLMELRDRVGDAGELFLILGMDSLAELDRWRRREDILALSTVVGFARPGTCGPDKATMASIRRDAARGLELLDGPQVGVSASGRRRRVAEGLSIRYRVPEPVEAYIYEHGLYGAKRRGKGGPGEQV